mmetsp:Transcript_9107/g.25471  ORF Transcript_9107/g.25471 Transcript_9107/m.25471 type:complete len:99 (+) Transcript_9107:237-533(+)
MPYLQLASLVTNSTARGAALKEQLVKRQEEIKEELTQEVDRIFGNMTNQPFHLRLSDENRQKMKKSLLASEHQMPPLSLLARFGAGTRGVTAPKGPAK